MLGIALCVVCLAGSTFAWFSESISAKENTIIAANFYGTVTVTADGETIAVSTEGDKHIAELAAGRTYVVTLAAEGEAAGYACVTLGEEKHYTSPLRGGDVLQFTVIPESDTTMEVCFLWGSYSGEGDISEGSTLTF